MTPIQKNNLEALASVDVMVLEEKGNTYGDSWKRRGGAGAFMMLARKWDRIENICAQQHGYDVFAACRENTGDILDDIADLRRYLLLVEEHVRWDVDNGAEPGPGYVNQDR